MSDPAVLRHERPWQRHELLRISVESWAAQLALNPELAATPLLRTWAFRGWPVVVRRPSERDAAHRVPIGIPLPPAAGKKRISLTVSRASVLERSLPPPLREVQGAADPSWLPTLLALVNVGRRAGVTPRAYGSLFWQYRTHLPYLSPNSDLDVLWELNETCDLERLLDGIASVQRDAPMRLDGEIVFPDGRAVHWRELHRGLQRPDSAEVLVRSMSGGHFVTISALSRTRGAA
jgi:phosphoribosyl-dephospho-CoA transferase